MFYILLVTVTQTRVKGSSTMAQTRRNEPYWRLNILVRRGFRPTLVGVANRKAVGVSIDPIDRYDQIKRFDKSIFSAELHCGTL